MKAVIRYLTELVRFLVLGLPEHWLFPQLPSYRESADHARVLAQLYNRRLIRQVRVDDDPEVLKAELVKRIADGERVRRRLLSRWLEPPWEWEKPEAAPTNVTRLDARRRVGAR